MAIRIDVSIPDSLQEEYYFLKGQHINLSGLFQDAIMQEYKRLKSPTTKTISNSEFTDEEIFKEVEKIKTNLPTTNEELIKYIATYTSSPNAYAQRWLNNPKEFLIAKEKILIRLAIAELKKSKDI